MAAYRSLNFPLKKDVPYSSVLTGHVIHL